MGTTNFGCRAHGMSEQQAFDNAVEADRLENGYDRDTAGISCSRGMVHSKCITKPKPAKTCSIKRTRSEGTRKWKTVYLVEPKWFDTLNHGKSKEVDGTQGEAIKVAKQLALKHNLEYIISITKKLVTGTTRIATVEPKKSVMGEWEFWGDARE